jgi:hypothetical protein
MHLAAILIAQLVGRRRNDLPNIVHVRRGGDDRQGDGRGEAA